MHVVIFAGGYGTRLKGVWDHPKCLAPIVGRPVIDHLFERIIQVQGLNSPFPFNGLDGIVLALGHKSQEVLHWYWTSGWQQKLGELVRVTVDEEPSGTANALRNALPAVSLPLMVMNGDTLPYFSLRVLAHKVSDKGMSSAFDQKTGHYAGVSLIHNSPRGVALLESIKLDSHLRSAFEFYLSEALRISVPGYLDIGTPEHFQFANTLGYKEP